MHTDRFSCKMPRRPIQNLLKRREILQRADQSRRTRAALLEACKFDPIFWINAFVWQFNPKSVGHYSTSRGPFVTWPFQDRAYRKLNDAIESQYDVVIEKSRDMGASWLCLMVLAHRSFFLGRQKFLVVSRDADAVDDSSDPDSLFWKVDYLLTHLPPWMLEAQVDYRVRDKKYRNVLSIEFPKTDSVMTGSASTGKVGVGGRATAMFADEFSQIKEDYEVLQRTSDTTGCRIFNGTHKGVKTAFYDLTKDPAIEKLRMHWTEHPDKIHGLYKSDADTRRLEILDKNYEFPRGYPFVLDGKIRSPWYDLQCVRKKSMKAVAIDLDMNAEGSLDQPFDYVMIERLIRKNCRPPEWQGDVAYDPGTGEFKGFVPNPQGFLSLWTPLVGLGRPLPSEYGIGIDNSTGRGATPTCASILCLRTGVKVGSYSNANIKPEDFAPLAAALGRAFHTGPQNGGDGSPAWLIWEATGPGGIMKKELLRLGYPRLYKRPAPTSRPAGTAETDLYGYNPGEKQNLEAIKAYEQALEDSRFVNPCENAMRECLLFKYNARGYIEHSRVESKGDLSGARVNHSDMAMADTMANMLLGDGAAAGGPRRVETMTEDSLMWRRQLYEIKRKEREIWA